jgi:hypothetical protein
MGSAALLHLWSVVLHPTVNRSVIDVQAPLEHHLLQVSVAQWIAQVPADTQQNNLSFKMTPFEWGGGMHEIGSSQFSEYRRGYSILAIFATQPHRKVAMVNGYWTIPGLTRELAVGDNWLYTRIRQGRFSEADLQRLPNFRIYLIRNDPVLLERLRTEASASRRYDTTRKQSDS